jgi:glycosyltransferase involved in cell wall biosynthesis
MFLGAFTFDPNIDAVQHFVAEVLPDLRARVPGLRLHIVGSDPTPEVRALAGDAVNVTGFVDDLSPYFDQCRAFVAPLRFGAGIKGKLLLSMAHGLPAVASPIAAEGIPAVEDRDLFVARAPRDWTDRIVRLLADDAAWTAMSAAGRSVVEKHYSRDAAGRHVDRLIAAVAEQRAAHLEPA